MRRSEFEIGEFLYGIPANEISEEYNPQGQRVFIHNGYVNEVGYGVLIGWNKGVINISGGWGNYMWTGKVRKATDEEKEKFLEALMNPDVTKCFL